ncbi:hypothetical protein ACIGXF_22590 [Streptomyces sp. NPDC053086]|uniref:hypothetical protein n=1 Tax=unclassified Streptomyces TaxID=2593676 RepID=UPI0037D28AA5
MLQLDGTNTHPPGKAVFIREITQPDGVTAMLLSRGILTDRQNPVKWGIPPGPFACPRDSAR